MIPTPISLIPEFSPTDLGLPAKFSSWRQGQYRAVVQSAEAEQRFVAHAMPTGGGKSMLAVATTSIIGGRGAYLTTTKSLQDQIVGDFRPCGMSDIRGAQNYHCGYTPRATCADGRLVGCVATDCPRKSAIAAAMKSNLVATNYDCYLYSYSEGEGLGAFDVLILDEGHSAVDQMCSFLEIKIDHSLYRDLYAEFHTTPPYRGLLPVWKKWAGDLAPRMKARLDDLKKEQAPVEEIRPCASLHRCLSKLSEAGDDWLIQEHHDGTITFSPIWPTDYTERYLFRGISHILILSATLTPKSVALLGIPQAELLFLNHPYTFDPRRAPIYLFGASGVDHKSTPEQLAEQSGRMDTIINHRLDRKGIIHSVSYDRQHGIVSRSHHSSIMIAPQSARDLAPAIAEFLSSPPPRILISPAITTGYDFPMSACEYAIIPKMPFQDTRPAIIAARIASDPDYSAHLTAQTLMQMCGRPMRSPLDQCETFILDRHANWFVGTHRRPGKHASLFAPWFLKQISYLDAPPQPPKPLAYSA